MDDGREEEGMRRRPSDGRPADDRPDEGYPGDEPRPSFRDAARHFEEPPPSLDDEWDEWLEPGAGAQRGEPGRGPGSGRRRPAAQPTRGEPPERRAASRLAGRRRRRMSAGAALAAMLLGFFVAGLLDAKSIETGVRGEPLGASRSVALALLRPMTLLSGALQLDRPAQALDSALGLSGGEHHTLAEAAQQKPLWPRPVTYAHPLKMYVAGDSMAQVFGSSLVNLAEKTNVIVGKLDYHVSTGLSRPDYFDWPQRLVDMIVEQKPDAAVMLFGANDAQAVSVDGRVFKVGSAGWRQVYAQRVSQAMDILTRGGRRVYWVGNPIMRDPVYRARVSMMDHIYQDEARKHPGVTYIPTWSLFADKKGSYADYLPDASGDLVLMRASDGIHLTRAGGDRMAQAVLNVIEKDWKIPQAQ